MRRLFSVVLCCVLFLGSVQCVFADAFKLEMGMTKQQVENALYDEFDALYDEFDGDKAFMEEEEKGFGYKYWVRRTTSLDYQVGNVTIHPVVGLVRFDVWKKVIPTAKNVRDVYTRAKNTILEKYEKEGEETFAILESLYGIRDTSGLNETDEQFMRRLNTVGIFQTEWKFDKTENEEFQKIALTLYSGHLSNKGVMVCISYYGYFYAEVSDKIEALKKQQKELKKQQKEAERKAEYDQF